MNHGGAWPLAGVDEPGDATVQVAVEGLLVHVMTNGIFGVAGSDPAALVDPSGGSPARWLRQVESGGWTPTEVPTGELSPRAPIGGPVCSALKEAVRR